MSFAQYETSRFSGSPINLYLFRYGPSAPQFIAYTDANDEVVFGTNEVDGTPIRYQPVPIDRGKITGSGTLDKTNLTITTQQNSALANIYLIYPPSQVTTLIVRQGHLDDPDQDYKVVFTGRVMSCSRKGSKAEFSCEPVSTSLRRAGLRRRYQFGCPLVLYGDDCRASKVAATTSTTVVALTSTRISLPADWAGISRAEKYVQGLAEWTLPDGGNEVRTILRSENSGQTFLLSGTTRGLIPGSTVRIVMGCNHKSGTPAQPDGDCGPLHNNVLNFGGQERIPFKNPIGLVNQFY